MKKIRLFFLIIIFTVFVSIITRCSIGAEEPKIDGGRDSTSYTYEQTVTVLYSHDSEFQDSAFCVGEENDPIISGYIYRFAYNDKKLFLNMNNKYYIFNTETNELSKLDNNEFYEKYTDFDTYKWHYPHLQSLK